MESPENAVAHPPETLEGWFALHQIFAIRHSAKAQRPRGEGRGGDATPHVESTQHSDTTSHPNRIGHALPDSPDGWTAWARLIGSDADLLAVHFASTLEGIAAREATVRDCIPESCSALTYSFLSVTEAGLYHLTAQLARDATERGGAVGDETYVADLARRGASERENPHVRRRLYPTLPADMPYVCFYPMSKRRDEGQNWYTLSLDERSRLMQAHGKTGRRYAGRVLQIITGAIGLDAWEWGVTLFAKDPLDFKKLVTDMRFDEVSAKYALFGDFYVGKVVPWEDVQLLLETR